MTNERNALAELAKCLEIAASKLQEDICLNYHIKQAKRIITELAKLQEEEAALHAMENITAAEAMRIFRQREGNCILKCRAIAERKEVK